MAPVPTYEFRCRECATTYEVKRPMSEASDPAPCPGGHTDTVKLLSMVSVATGAGPSGGGGGGGGCCGGACGCG